MSVTPGRMSRCSSDDKIASPPTWRTSSCQRDRAWASEPRKRASHKGGGKRLKVGLGVQRVKRERGLATTFCPGNQPLTLPLSQRTCASGRLVRMCPMKVMTDCASLGRAKPNPHTQSPPPCFSQPPSSLTHLCSVPLPAYPTCLPPPHPPFPATPVRPGGWPGCGQ